VERVNDGQTRKVEIMRPEASHAAEFAVVVWSDASRQGRARTECRVFCETLCDRLERGLLSPDEAYWWTRIAVEEAAAIELEAAAA
jgi:hypothetical protein